LASCGGSSETATEASVQTKTVTQTVTASTTATATASPSGLPRASEAEIQRVIETRGDVVCLMFQTQGMNQKTLDDVAVYVLSTPAIKLTKQEAIQVIRGSVESYCPEFSKPIASVFG